MKEKMVSPPRGESTSAPRGAPIPGWPCPGARAPGYRLPPLRGLEMSIRRGEASRIGSRGPAMTEAEWLTSTDPAPMRKFMKGKVSDRKVRLLAIACCRSVWDLLVEDRSRTAIL